MAGVQDRWTWRVLSMRFRRCSVRGRRYIALLPLLALALATRCAVRCYTNVSQSLARRNVVWQSTGAVRHTSLVASRSFADRWASVTDVESELDEPAGLDVRAVRQQRGGTKLRSGQYVKARWEDGLWYPATVLSLQQDGTVTLRWEEWGVESGISPSNIRRAKKDATAVNELEIGSKLSGKVTRIVSYGAFVDVGAEWDGLVPLAKMATDSGNEAPENALQVGKVVDVWVSRVREDGALELAMEPSKVGGPIQQSDGGPAGRLQPADLRVGQTLRGRVSRVVKYGAFVDIGAARDGLVPAKFGMQKLGAEVDVVISKLRPDGSIELTLGTTPEKSVLELSQGQRLVGRVSNKVPYGLFVDVGAQRDGLVPLSKMSGDLAQTYQTMLAVGEVVEVWVSKVRKDGTFELTMVEEESKDELEGFDRMTNPSPKGSKDTALDVGAQVKAQWEDGSWYTATVQEDHGDGTVTIAWSEYEVETRALRSKLRIPRPGGLPVDLLEVGQKMDGKVSRIVDFGVFVDVGAEWDGLVPLNKLGTADTTTMQAGDSVDVWVSRVREDGAVELSMVEPKAPRKDIKKNQDVSAFQGISDREWLKGKVRWVHSAGAFVTLQSPDGSGEEVDGHVHLSELSAGYTQDPFQEVVVGQPVKVRVMDVDLALGRLKLSMREPPVASVPAPKEMIEELNLPDVSAEEQEAQLGFGSRRYGGGGDTDAMPEEDRAAGRTSPPPAPAPEPTYGTWE